MAKILVIDDWSKNREFLVTLLGYFNHQLLEATDGQMGLELTRSEHPDLVIADIIMPTMNGYEFVSQLRAEQAISQTPVILFSAAFLESEAYQLAAACGVKYLITKPCEPQEMLEKVNAALGSRAPESMPKIDENSFDRNHQRLLSNKLAAKVNELEELTSTLKRRVEARGRELEVATAQMHHLTVVREELRQQRAASQQELTDLRRLTASVESSVGKVGDGRPETLTNISTNLIILGFILAYVVGMFTMPLIEWIRAMFHF
jgi:DNA-binding response OmpR family regulator